MHIIGTCLQQYTSYWQHFVLIVVILKPTSKSGMLPSAIMALFNTVHYIKN